MITSPSLLFLLLLQVPQSFLAKTTLPFPTACRTEMEDFGTDHQKGGDEDETGAANAGIQFHEKLLGVNVYCGTIQAAYQA